ncbi:MAG: flagellar biosynthetic protein FliR [Gammaproteobacteria bacterium]|nr:flagellar biosynthetic protein FliR [Gammaproteobacteria bacterium]
MSAITITVAQLTEFVGVVMWPLFRIAALFSIVPIVGGSEVPVRVRVGLALLVTLLIVPTLDSAPAVDPLTVNGIVVTVQQMMIGFAMGLMVLVVFNAVAMAGENIAITMGLGFALLNDPQNGVQVPTVSQFYVVFATLLFLALNGHLAVLNLIASSFVLIPVGAALSIDSVWHLLSWAAILFKGALAIALPALAAMLAVNMVMGVVTRSAPQMNIFSIGFPITMTVGFVAMLLTLPSVKHEFALLWSDTVASILTLLAK